MAVRTAPEWFESAVRTMHELSRDGSLTAALRSQLAVEVLLDVWSRAPVPGAGTTGRSTLADALAVTDLVEHFLRPLQLRAPATDLVHATANGPSVLVGLTAKWRAGTPSCSPNTASTCASGCWRCVARGTGGRCGPCSYGSSTGSPSSATDAPTPCCPSATSTAAGRRRGGAPPDRVRTLHNGVSHDDFPVLDDEPAEPTLAFAGRIDPLKDLATLVRAVALVREQVPAVRLRLFGSVPEGNEGYAEEIRRLADDLGLAGAVTFEGPVSPVTRAFAAGQVVVMSSTSEGLPLTVIEAAMSGRPTVVTDAGGMAEAAGDGGLVVPPGNPAAFAAACVALLTHPGRRKELGAAGRRYALAHFTRDRFVADVRGLYAEFAAPAAARDGRPRTGEARRDRDGSAEPRGGRA